MLYSTSYVSIADVATMDPMLFMDFLAALRLCINLESFTWTFPLNAPHNRTERVFIDYLYVLKRLRVPKLNIRATHGVSAQVLTKLMYMNDLKSISELRSKGEFRRFLDDMGYLFEGLDPQVAVNVRRGRCVKLDVH